MPTKSLEDRIREIEDRLEIYNLIASHPPGADTGSEDWIKTYWVEDGVMDLGGKANHGRTDIAAGVKMPEHQAAIAAGICHFAGLPRIELNGDTAVVTSYLQILVPQTQGEPVTVPNHGTSKGFRAHRVGSNRWDLVRTKDGWKVKHRVSRPLDGSEPARKILRQALEDAMHKKAG
ncbi:MAG TPA: nuclear transport factor 2 family protein [Stellaceae bacterium]|nr:nuclear transport factor 2 family protein [Stellaceae bacterium]